MPNLETNFRLLLILAFSGFKYGLSLDEINKEIEKVNKSHKTVQNKNQFCAVLFFQKFGANAIN